MKKENQLDAADFDSADVDNDSSVDDDVIVSVGDRGIKLTVGSLMKVNPRFGHCIHCVYRVVQIMTVGKAKELTEKYRRNREEIDELENYNDFITSLIDMVSEDVSLKEIRERIDLELQNQGITANSEYKEGNHYYQIKILFQYMYDLAEKNKIKRELKSRKLKSKKYKNYSMLLSNLGIRETTSSESLGFTDDEVLIGIVSNEGKSTKPMWTLARAMILVTDKGDIELWEALKS